MPKTSTASGTVRLAYWLIPSGTGRLGGVDIFDASWNTWWERYYSYDKLGRMTGISTMGASRAHSYSYNDVGQRESHTITSPSEPTFVGVAVAIGLG